MNSLLYNIKTFGLINGFKWWIREFKRCRERCAYCGWYLHPNLLFKNVSVPMRMCNWQELDGNFVCSKCHYLWSYMLINKKL